MRPADPPKTNCFQSTIRAWDRPLLAYAAARDAACWQLDRTEVKVWSLLEGLDPSI